MNTKRLLENDAEKFVLEVEEYISNCPYDIADAIDWEAIGSMSWEYAQGKLDDHYDNKYEQMKEERAGICN